MISSNGTDPIHPDTGFDARPTPNTGSLTATESPVTPSHVPAQPAYATRSKRGAEATTVDRIVIIAGGAVVVALLLFVSWSVPHKSKRPAVARTSANAAAKEDAQRSFLPITDSARSGEKGKRDEVVREEDIQRTATESPATKSNDIGAKGSLGAVQPFDGQQAWQAPPFQPAANVNPADTPETTRAERDALSKSSLVFVRGTAGQPALSSPTSGIVSGPDVGLGLPTGTRLQARLAYAASTALKTRVVAVVEYNYERNGEIVVPAGTMAIGNIEQADRSGYLSIRFDSLQLPDGSKTSLDAIATDLNAQALKGHVEGKNTGKSLLARSLSGIGEGAALFVGRGSLNQPLSEQDLLRERVGDNIGLASDQQVSRLALTEHVIVSLSAGTPIYIVLQDSAKQIKPAESPTRGASQSSTPNAQELRELLQLQKELNQSVAPSSPNN